MDNTQSNLMTETQLSQLLSVSKAALRRWRREGRGPQFRKVERCIRYLFADVQSFLDENSSAKKKAADLRSAAHKREVRSEHATTHNL